jgi:hypothetical protein
VQLSAVAAKVPYFPSLHCILHTQFGYVPNKIGFLSHFRLHVFAWYITGSSEVTGRGRIRIGVYLRAWIFLTHLYDGMAYIYRPLSPRYPPYTHCISLCVSTFVVIGLRSALAQHSGNFASTFLSLTPVTLETLYCFSKANFPCVICSRVLAHRIIQKKH